MVNVTDVTSKHVFVSYVREDADKVDGLCAVLEAAQIPYWRDRKDLGPGDAWKARIKSAIRDGSLVFLACFSDNQRAKIKSYMNEELTVAVDEFRQMPPGRVWLIPVRFDAGEVPDWDLGAGRSLSDLNYSDLFGDQHIAQAARLVTTIGRLLGEKQPSATTTMAAVEQAVSTDRIEILRKLTKEMLLDPSRRITLDDMVIQEVQRVLTAIKDPSRVSGPIGGSGEDHIVAFAEEAQALTELVLPFCASLQVAVRWGAPTSLASWAGGIRSFVAAGHKIEGGIQALLHLRHLPGMVSITTAAIAAVASGNWENFKVTVLESTVSMQHHQGTLSLLDATNFGQPFADGNQFVANALAGAKLKGETLREALEDFTVRRQGVYHTPVSEWLYATLRPIFAEQVPDDDAYATIFDRAEILLGILAEDAAKTRQGLNPERAYLSRSHWFGRSTWRTAQSNYNPVTELADEIAAQGAQWAPLRAGLFAGDIERATGATLGYRETFDQLVRQRMFS